MNLDENWVIEVCEEGGSAFALRGSQKVFEQQSAYQKIEVFETDTYGKLMLIDGYTMLSSRDNFIYHEMLSHPVLYSHPAPRRVAIIGGGDCGTLHEVLKHRTVERVTQIDIDEVVTQAARLHFPELCASNTDPRAELLFADGIRWMEQAPPGSLDIVIVDSTDPIGPGEVLFTPAFYSACYRALDEGGLVVQQSESPLIHLPIVERIHRSLHGASFHTTQTLFFPQPVYPTGWWSATIGTKGIGLNGFREADVAASDIETRYYNAEVHRAAFAQPEFFRQASETWV